MNSIRSSLAVAILVPSVLAACGSDVDVNAEAPLAERASYSIGVEIGMNLAQTQADVSIDHIASGIRDGMANDPTMTPQEMRASVQEFMTQAQAAAAEASRELAQRNREEGEAFLAENASKDGVVTTSSGLQYEVLEAGDGTRPAATDRVRVHYSGALLDGTVFDSSYDRGEPYTTTLNNVIAGWTEGVQLMPVGAKYRFWIPSSLGYGAGGSGRSIGPDATLVFEVELLEIL